MNDKINGVNGIVQNLKENGFHIFRGAVSAYEISSLKLDINVILANYNEQSVKDRLFYRREDSYNRQGDAVMVSDCGSALPHIDISGSKELSKYFNIYNSIIEEAIGAKMRPEYKRTMLNVQQYFKDSLPTWDHQDMESFAYRHEFNPVTMEDALVLEKALIPRYVMVIVLENENNGKGVYVRKHDSQERIDMELFPGDILIFDNIAMRHGVPALDNPRMMIGFRNFSYEPLYFEEAPEGGNNWIELPDKLNSGWGMYIHSEEAEEMMLEFNKYWKEEGYEENVRTSKPAF